MLESRTAAPEEAREVLAEAGFDIVTVLAKDGFHEIPDQQPFDRIIAAVGCSDTSPHWIDRLSADGKRLVPLQHGQTDDLLRLSPDEDLLGVHRRGAIGCAEFMSVEGLMSCANSRCCLIPLQCRMRKPGEFRFPLACPNALTTHLFGRTRTTPSRRFQNSPCSEASIPQPAILTL